MRSKSDEPRIISIPQAELDKGRADFDKQEKRLRRELAGSVVQRLEKDSVPRRLFWRLRKGSST